MFDASSSTTLIARAQAYIQSGDTDALTALLDDRSKLTPDELSRLLYDIGVNSVVRSYPNAVQTASALIDAGADPLDTTWSAACVGSIPILELLVSRGVPVDGGGRSWTPLDESLYWGFTDAAKFLVASGAPIVSLRAAAGIGDVAALDRFFVDGALRPTAGALDSPFGSSIPDHMSVKPQYLIDNALMFAAMNGQLETARRLLEHGAEINSITPGAHHGATALHCAAWKAPVAMVQFLVERGGDPKTPDSGDGGQSALDWATFYKRDDVVEYLATVMPAD